MCSTPAILKSILSSVSAVIEVSWSASKISSTPFKSTAAAKSFSLADDTTPSYIEFSIIFDNAIFNSFYYMTIYNTYPSAAAIAVAKAFVAALVDVIKVPLSFGNVIVLSAVGSVTVKVVSCASAVAPSNTILASVKFN